MTLFPGTNDFNKNPFAKVYDNIQCKKARPADYSVLFQFSINLIEKRPKPERNKGLIFFSKAKQFLERAED